MPQGPASPSSAVEDRAFDAFRRDDVYGPAGKGPLPLPERLRLYALLVVLAPLRLTLALLLLLLFYANLKLAHWIPLYGATGLPTAINRGYTRACLFVLGFMYIEYHDLCKERSDDDNFPSLIVSNHASWVDTVVHFYLYFPASFIMKQGVFKVPIIGDIGKLIRCIGVVREDKASDHKGVSEVVTERLKDEHSLPPKKRQPVLLFPEGTTTNNRCMLPFKSGAFIAGVPAKPIALMYSTGRVAPTWESIDILQHLKLMLANPFHRLSIYELPTYYPDEAEQEDPKLYAANLQAHMMDDIDLPQAKHSKLKICNSTLGDKRRYHELLSQLTAKPKRAEDTVELMPTQSARSDDVNGAQ